VTLTLTKKAVSWLATKGHNDVFGARPLARLILKEVRRPLAEEMLFGKLRDGGHVTVNLKGDKIVFKYNHS
jgi:ATP-dependent Clp protease ATP-binding subunit ClpA